MESKGMLFRWRRMEESVLDGDTDPTARLARELGVEPIVAALLHRRGMGDVSRAQTFLHPKLTNLHDPALMPGLSAAAARMVQAVRDRQAIVIYGDYDVDGVAASAILWHILKLAGADVHTYIPHRIDEGYGLNAEALLALGKEHARDGRPPLIISVDCGITAIAPAKAACDAGIELIITDHHEFNPHDLPAAVTIVHPRLPSSSEFKVLSSESKHSSEMSPDANQSTQNSELRTQNTVYPFPDLCGAGVAFKLAWQFAKVHTGSDRVPEVFRTLLLDLLSIAALGTVADIVPLVDENRVITTFGLGQIKRTRFIGLNAMIDSTGLRKETIDAFHVGFVLGPRLNACGRMGHAADALKLLTTVTAEEAPPLADFLTQENDRRRETERAIAAQARQMVLDQGLDQPQHRAIVLGCENWHPGVIGIVCSRLVEEFHRPTILLNFADGEAHGSGRSVPGINIHEALEQCADLIKSFGGHAMAAGLRMERARYDEFRARFTSYINDRLGVEDLMPVIDIDAQCTLPQVTLAMVDQVQTLAPFGRDNPSPVLCVRDVQLAECARRIGQAGAHLRLQLRQERTLMQAVGWRMGDLAEQLPAGARVDVVFEPKVNNWEGRRRPDMHIKDIRIVRCEGGM